MLTMSSAYLGEVIVHRYAGILSAYGMGLADVIEEAQEPFTAKYGPAALEEVSRRSTVLSQEVKKQLRLQVISLAH
jgi:5-oxoprolinase (ATP-hydrolysing)